MKPISNEKRELLVAAKRRGEKEHDIAKWLALSKSSIKTYGPVEKYPYRLQLQSVFMISCVTGMEGV
jgi:hypothetical protein